MPIAAAPPLSLRNSVFARSRRTACALIDDPQIDAVLIASSDETHFDLSMTCVRLGKPVFCEKPLAMTSTDCLRLVEAEMGVGRRLLQVGFMRRFDQGYLDMKAAVDGKRFGSPLFLHCIHRIATAPHYFKTELIPFASAVHEIDAARFVLGEEFIRVSVHPGRPSANAPERCPLLFIFQSASGVLMDVEISTDAQYGYDVRAELVMESGALALVPPSASTISWEGSVGNRVHSRLDHAFRSGIPAAGDGVDSVDRNEDTLRSLGLGRVRRNKAGRGLCHRSS